MSRTLKVYSSSVTKTIKSYDETGSHEDRHRKGRPRVTSAAEDSFIRVTSLGASRVAQWSRALHRIASWSIRDSGFSFPVAVVMRGSFIIAIGVVCDCT